MIRVMSVQDIHGGECGRRQRPSKAGGGQDPLQKIVYYIRCREMGENCSSL